jgi:2-desacetyl-2-hydroxyethyl bacteriochlorophyllide A dehydrogenase
VRAVPGRLLVEQGPVPVPASGQALVASTLVGVCGSDLHAVAGHHPFVPLPYRPGHEVVGVVSALSAGLRDAPSAGAAAGFGAPRVQVGDRVLLEPTLHCGRCKQCRAGRPNLCEQLEFFGCTHPQGGMARWFTVRTDRLHVLPADLSDEQAALVEPLATPVHAVRLASGARAGERADLSGRTVAVLGAGTIGLLVLAAVRWAGASRVIVTDVLASKRERARRLGADDVIDAAAPDAVQQARNALGESADVVFDCVGVQSTIDQGIAMALKGGTVVVVGVPATPVTVPLPEIQDRQVRLQGSATYTSDDYAVAMSVIAGGAVDPANLITMVVPLEEVDQAFTAASSGEHVKVLVRP